MALRIYLTPGIDEEQVRNALCDPSLKISRLNDPSDLSDAESLFLIVDHTFRGARDDPWFQRVVGLYLVVDNEQNIEGMNFRANLLIDHSVKQIVPQKLRNLLQAALLTDQIAGIKKERDVHLRRLKELTEIGIALSTERDLEKLLHMILRKSREITSADAGSLYLIEGDEETGKHLRFKVSQTDSLTVNYEEFAMPLTKGSIAGYVAVTGESLNIPDVYKISMEKEYRFNRDLDESTGYRTASMLAVPMRNHKGQMIGVIQLINRKKDFSIQLTGENVDCIQPFDENDEELVTSLASQAAVAFENSLLIKSIEHLFEGFVTASVTAIESRDPTTSGHSFRVADLTVGLAEMVDRSEAQKFRLTNFSYNELKEIRYAALLHDFGKVGVRENVLVKAKKLYPEQLEFVRQRIRYFKKAWESEFFKAKLNLLLREGKVNFEVESAVLDQLYQARVQSLEEYLQFIVQSNEPTVLPEGNFERLLRMASERDLIPPGVDDPILTSQEVQLLSIPKGSLNDNERVEIESHVTHTFLFLTKIPWTDELKQVPRIAYGHHEKLNGSGYPNRLLAADIPIQTRMMTIADIYDALTASDRPYKRAVPAEKALDILTFEVKAQQLDPDLFRLFVDAKVFQRTAGK